MGPDPSLAPRRSCSTEGIIVTWRADGADANLVRIFEGTALDAVEHIRRNFISETVVKRANRAESLRVANVPLPAVQAAFALGEPVEVRIGRASFVIVLLGIGDGLESTAAYGSLVAAMRANGSPDPVAAIDVLGLHDRHPPDPPRGGRAAGDLGCVVSRPNARGNRSPLPPPVPVG